ncbi:MULTISPECIES: hypothetical protein [unclassified Picosynechococcus]|uniref:hypothetical protein n=1 Tax=unclassified Picosynechococcus TaxID=3079910 RepID=UPI0002DDA128|nr:MULTISPECIES: hypothetical protein [unclassified Picosynechococcus]
MNTTGFVGVIYFTGDLPWGIFGGDRLRDSHHWPLALSLGSPVTHHVQSDK